MEKERYIGVLQGYDPFGSLLPGRNFSSNSYRFGFQGQVKDDEVYGATGTSYAFEYRMHDTRVGRFWSIDPLAAKYPHNSPYAFSENRVIDAFELEGLESVTLNDGSKVNTGPASKEYQEKIGGGNIKTWADGTPAASGNSNSSLLTWGADRFNDSPSKASATPPIPVTTEIEHGVDLPPTTLGKGRVARFASVTQGTPGAAGLKVTTDGQTVQDVQITTDQTLGPITLSTSVSGTLNIGFGVKLSGPDDLMGDNMYSEFSISSEGFGHEWGRESEEGYKVGMRQTFKPNALGTGVIVGAAALTIATDGASLRLLGRAVALP